MPRACPVNLLFLIKESLKKINISLQILFFFLERERERERGLPTSHTNSNWEMTTESYYILIIRLKKKNP